MTQDGPADLLLQWALYYASLGWRVFPLAPRSKVPLVSGGRGYLDATTDPEQITRWWTAEPNANIGLALAPSGLVALDDDPRDGGDATIAPWAALLPNTTTSRTGGADQGRHIIMQDTGGPYRKDLGPGVQVKHNGHIVLPPSVHPDSGLQYQWLVPPNQILPAPVPVLLLAAMRKLDGSQVRQQPLPAPNHEPAFAAPVRQQALPAGATGTPQGLAELSKACQEIRNAAHGERNNTLNRAAFTIGQFVAGGQLEESHATRELHRAAIASGLDDAETERTIRSGLAAGKLRPLHGAPAQPSNIEWSVFTLGDQWGHFMALLDRRASTGFRPIPTGLSSLDNLLGGGFERGQVALLCAPPGSGKTSVAIDWGVTFARQQSGGPVLYWSLEMAATDILARVATLEYQIPWNKVRRGEHIEACRALGTTLSGIPFIVVDGSACPTMEAFEAIAGRIAQHWGLPPLCILDYVQLLAAPTGTEIRQSMEHVSTSLLGFASRTECAVLELSSVGRGAYSPTRSNGRPDLSRVLGMAKESGKWESDAAVVLGIVRSRTEDEDPRTQKAWIAVAKNRLGGGLGSVPVAFDGLRGRFTEISPDQMPEARAGGAGRDYRAEIVQALGSAQQNGTEGPRNRTEVAKLIGGGNAGAVGKALNDLVAQGVVVRAGNERKGYYHLAMSLVPEFGSPIGSGNGNRRSPFPTPLPSVYVASPAAGTELPPQTG